jgi:hypothetical protein
MAAQFDASQYGFFGGSAPGGDDATALLSELEGASGGPAADRARCARPIPLQLVNNWLPSRWLQKHLHYTATPCHQRHLARGNQTQPHFSLLTPPPAHSLNVAGPTRARRRVATARATICGAAPCFPTSSTPSSTWALTAAGAAPLPPRLAPPARPAAPSSSSSQRSCPPFGAMPRWVVWCGQQGWMQAGTEGWRSLCTASFLPQPPTHMLTICRPIAAPTLSYPLLPAGRSHRPLWQLSGWAAPGHGLLTALTQEPTSPQRRFGGGAGELLLRPSAAAAAAAAVRRLFDFRSTAMPARQAAVDRSIIPSQY